MPRELGERLDGSRQAALVTSSSVRVKNALAAHGVDHALGVLESFLSSGLIAGEDELANALDSGTVLAALSREVLIAGKGLTGALAGLVGIGHLVLNSGKWMPRFSDSRQRAQACAFAFQTSPFAARHLAEIGRV